MTKRLRNKTVCPQCGHAFDTSTPFSQWVRNLPAPLDSRNYDYQNMDGIWNCYREAWFITVEEKRYGAHSNATSQRDTHQMVYQLLRIASKSVIETLRGKRPYVYKGHYEISFENTNPQDSAWVEINGTRFNAKIPGVVQYLLRYGVLPIISA